MDRIHSISELNAVPHCHDSHKGECGRASLEEDRRSVVKLGEEELGTRLPFYPRLKKLSDGSLILFYNTGKTDPSICYITSANGVDWSKPRFLARSQQLEDGDESYFATADAVELKNGDLVAAYSFRTRKTYTTDLSKSGVAVRISHDKGQTWDEPQTVYVGMNWEPNLMQDKNGVLYCIFTHTAPYVHYYGYNRVIRSSGSAIVRSQDNGHTWTPVVMGAPYEAQRVMQSYIGDMDGRKIFNDQMPVMLELNCGRQMIACESQQFEKKYFISLGYSSDGWTKELGIEEEGPEERSTNVFGGAGPYLAQFRSGETLLSYARNGLNIAIGNERGEEFGGHSRYFLHDVSSVYWPCLENDGGHSVYAAMEKVKWENKAIASTELVYGKIYINHSINAKKLTKEINGSADGWEDNTEAFFLGSVSQAQSAYRFAHDDNNVYILSERLDSCLSEGDRDEICLSADGKSYVKLEYSPNGLASAKQYGGENKVEAYAECTVFEGAKESSGYVTELAVRKDAIPGLNDTLFVNVKLYNTDGDTVCDVNTFKGVCDEDINTWKKVSLV